MIPSQRSSFYNLVRIGFYDGTRFFRAIDRFMVQWVRAVSAACHDVGVGAGAD